MIDAPPHLLGRHVVLVGPMAVGKTTIGHLVADAIGRRFEDSDDVVARLRGTNVRELWSSEGREALHRAEAEALGSLLSSAQLLVIAAAASVLDDEVCRRALGAHADVIALDADAAVRASRIASGPPRPTTGSADAELARLEGDRAAEATSLASTHVDTSQLAPAAAAAAIVASLHRRVSFELGARRYDVVIGPGARAEAGPLIPGGARRAAIVTQPDIPFHLELPVPAEVFEIRHGESAKSLQTIEQLCRGFSRFGLTRSDVVVALGGGVVSDTAGYAAASYHRGTPVLNVPTTLLGQIDAAIGGKTGVNLPEGKNLVGAFWQPCGVLCDTDTLETMPDRERRSGLGEMAKYAFLGVEDLDRLTIVEQVAACVAAKAAVVEADERESDARMTLNYGHTLAHALEAAGFADGLGRDGIDLRHGEAVAIGLVFAARLARRLGRIDEARVERHLALVSSYGLPSELPGVIDVDEIIELMGRDKKARGGLTFVLDSPGGVEVVDDVDPEVVREVLHAGLAEPAKAGATP